ncbi:MAG TPA: phenylalanine--tRNA ligase subunit beta [Gemmatimonadales bacterium]|jgi:phenylalanyl-tRNA synthetase beta chain
MNVSRQWLEAFLHQRLDGRDIAARLAMLGAPVDAIETVGADLRAFVVAVVTDVRPHPNADKLRVTTVDDGSGELFNVVCGASNVVAGHKYPFARIGTVMPGGATIERRKLRGEPSEGMLCSARELGLGDDRDGLLTLDTSAAPGTPLAAVLDAGDERLVIDVTANRPDLLCHKGVARELAASLGVPFRLPEIPDEVSLDLPTPARFGDEAPVGGIRLAIDDRDGCGRFIAAVIRGVKVGPSPEWLRRRLVSVGLRSINNVVDATNYIMLELNQPLHAYDAATLRGATIVARASRAGDRLVTLDGTDRAVPDGAVVIADAERVIGIAGVMGGSDTEVTEATTDIFLECAWFNPVRVRRARRALDMATEASHRFERGVDRWGAVDAFRRCVRLMVTIAGGALDGSAVDCFPAPTHPPRLFLRPARVAQVLGVDLTWQEIERQLVAIGATVVNKPDDGRIAVDVPGWRPDITAEIDLVEEVARMYGYERFPTELGAFRPGLRGDDPAWTVAARVRLALAAQGLSEVITLPMVATAGAAAPRVVNPLSADHGLLRDALVPSLIREVESNWAMHTADVRLFELGTGFAMGASGGLPTEELRAAFVVTGARAPAHWTDHGKTPVWDRWDALGLFELLVDLAQPSAKVQVEGNAWIARLNDGRTVGRCGSSGADAPPWAAALFAGEISLQWQSVARSSFAPLPTYPAIARDLALLLDPSRTAESVTALLAERGRRHGLESVAVIDEYRGKELPKGRRSVTVRLVFRSAGRTLTDSEVELALGRLRTSLERELDVTVRTT